MLNQFEQQLRDLDQISDHGHPFQTDTQMAGLPSNEILRALHRNEDGDAELFICLQRDRLVYDHAAGRWFTWTGQHWELDATESALARVAGVADAYLQELARQGWLRGGAEKAGQTKTADQARSLEDKLARRVRDLQTIKRKLNILHLSRAGDGSLGISGSEWDQDPWLFGVLNGVIDLKTGELHPGNPADYVRTFSNVGYKGLDEPCPQWDSFISEVSNEDEEIQQFKQSFYGYCLTGNVSENRVPILCGTGRNGKTTEIQTISYIFGGYSGVADPELLLAQGKARQSGSATSDIMSLRGKRWVSCSEIEQGRHFNAAKFKWLSGGNTLTGRDPYGRDQVSFPPTHKVILDTNYKPHIDADDYAFWKRVVLIPFKRAFVQNPTLSHEVQADPDLPQKLKQESSGIIAWLVRGCLRWQSAGLPIPARLQDATREYQADEDTLGQFIEERCVVTNNVRVKSSALYAAYSKWCADRGFRPLNATNFGTKVKGKFDSTKDYQGVFYLGLEVAPE
jgi:putative DNA primase/helicase